ncbi:MAG: TRAP transporter small permease [Ignavibacteriales bacterium]|nr:TRAP transporter small permease [Ignavibacteriales bacterium]
MKYLNIINQGVHWVERSLIVILLLTMVILAFTQVILRNLFSYGFLWADPLLRYMVLWVGFLGAVIATREGKHFGVDFLNRYLPKKTLHIVRILINVFAAVISFMLMSAAIQFINEAIGPEEVDVFEISKRFYFSIIPIGFGLIGFQFLFNILNEISKIFRNEMQTSPEPPHTFF